MASIFDTPPPPVFTRDGRDGFPPEADFEGIMAEYIDGLNPRKRDKALMTQAMYDTILIILTNPHDTRCATAQFRFWTKKMFRLVTTSHAHIVTHENRPVAVKEQIYDVLVQCHQQCSHGGRDKTSNQVRRYYSWIPKELIARFVKACPLCNARRNAKGGGGGGSSTNLAALGPDGGSSLASGSSSVGDSSSPSDASTSSDSAVTTPSRQMRPLGLPSSNSMPFTPGSYLASAMYHGMPMSATSISSSLPPMPSPSHNPQDWTQWVNNTPQRVALSQSVGSNGSVSQESVQHGNSNPTLHFTYHTGAPAHGQNTPATHAISLQTPPHSASQINDHSHSNQMQQQVPDAHALNSDTAMSYAQPAAPSAETQAYYSQLMQQTMASFLQAPPMTSQWSSDSVTTVSSCTSASSRSSVELEDLTDSAANSPLPPLPFEQGKDGSDSVFQQQIDNLTAHLGGVTAHNVEDEEEASFQSFMSTFKTTQQVEQDQIDPLLRAMNVDVMNGMPLVGESLQATVPLAPTTTLEDSPAVPQQSPARTKKKASPAPLGGNTFKFPPAPSKADAKKNDKKNAKSLARKGSKEKAYPKESKNVDASTMSRTDSDTGNTSIEGQERAVAPTASTPDLSAYFQLQNTFNQMRDGFVSGGNTPALGSNTSYTSNQGQQGTPAATQWQGNGNESLSQSMASSAHAEFSFNVSDMSADVSTIHTNDTFNVNTAMASNTMDTGNDGKTRPRPPQLDFSSFSNNNAFSPAEYITSEQDLQMNNDNSYLAAFQYGSNEFNQSTSGSVSAPAHITQFTQPEMPIITPDVPLFNYEQQMNMNLGFVGNSFVDYTGSIGMDQYGLPSATSPDIQYDYNGNNSNNQSLHPQGQKASLRPASAGGYLEPNAYGSPQKSMAQQRQQHMALMPAIHSAPLYHLPVSSQQQQAQARELSEQIQAILDNAVPTNDAMIEQAATAGGSSRPSRKR